MTAATVAEPGTRPPGEEGPARPPEPSPGHGHQGPLGALRNPNFARFWSAFTLSMTGSWVRITAMGVLVYDLTGDPSSWA